MRVLRILDRPASRIPEPAAALVLGLATVAALTAYDIQGGAHTSLIGTVVLGPFVTALLGSARQTLLVALVAGACATASGLWNETFGELVYALRLLVVFAGGGVALVAAVNRQRRSVDAARFGVLMELAHVVDGSLSVTQVVERIERTLVPLVCDHCIFDVVRDGRLERLSVKASGPQAQRVEELLTARRPPAASGGVGAAAAFGAVALVEIDDDVRRAVAVDERDLELLREVDARWAISVPLHARGRGLGVLTLSVSGVSGRRYEQRDVEFATVVGGRAALALDNAGLSRDLRDLEAQLALSLGGLAEAVTVTDASGRTVYANGAALELLGFEDPEQLYASEPQDVMARFEVIDADGRPVDLERLPGRRVLLGEQDVEPLLVRNVVKATGEERWLLNSTSPVIGEDGSVVRVVNVIENLTTVKRAEQESRLLARVSEVLATSPDFQATLQRTVELAVPALADYCAVAMPDGRGMIETVAVAHADPERSAYARRMAHHLTVSSGSQGGAAGVIRDGRPELLNGITDELLAATGLPEAQLEVLRGLGLRASLTVPMIAAGRTVGVLSLISAESGRVFTDDDVPFVQEVARRAGAAVENARLFSERSEIAATLQGALAPPQLPEIAGWDVAALYSPVGESNEVGGDFYDLFETPRGRLAVIGDVTGHGAQAAKLTAQARYTLRAVAQLTGDPLAAVTQLNDALCAESEVTLVTAACVLLQPGPAERTKLAMVCCGHPLPIHVAGGVARPAGAPGRVLGASQARWELTALELGAGEALVLYSDGVSDVLGAGGRFGEARLLAALGEPAGSAAELIANVAARISAFRTQPQRDDEALLVLRFGG